MQADLRFCSLRLCNHVSLEKLHERLLSQTIRSKGHALRFTDESTAIHSHTAPSAAIDGKERYDFDWPRSCPTSLNDRIAQGFLLACRSPSSLPKSNNRWSIRVPAWHVIRELKQTDCRDRANKNVETWLENVLKRLMTYDVRTLITSEGWPVSRYQAPMTTNHERVVSSWFHLPRKAPYLY
jgi:hypothetical protein